MSTKCFRQIVRTFFCVYIILLFSFTSPFSIMLSNVQSILACIMLAVLCVLSTMYVLHQCCTLSPSSSAEWLSMSGVVLLFVLVFAYLCKRTVKCMNDKDTFSNYNWGLANEDELTRQASPFDSEHTTTITGPEPNGSLHTWQYNPQNTLVDYAFYESPANGDSPVRLSPLADGSIGKRDQAPDTRSGVGVCNSNPAQQTYSVKSAASAQTVPTGTIGWGEHSERVN